MGLKKSKKAKIIEKNSKNRQNGTVMRKNS